MPWLDELAIGPIKTSLEAASLAKLNFINHIEQP